jgi:MFS family permease
MPESDAPRYPYPRPRFFYGYYIVIAAFFIMLVYGMTRSSFGVFFKPIIEEMGWNSASLSSAYSISIFIEGGGGIIMGIISDRLGPKIVVLLCGFLLGLGFFLVSLSNALWQMYLIFGLLIGMGLSGVFVPLITTIARWFYVRRNSMSGLILIGSGIGSLISGPVANWLISTYDWRQSYVIFSIVVFIVFILVSLFLKRDPSQVGQMPDGRYAPEKHESQSDTTGFTLKQSMATSQFWFTSLMFFCFGFCSFSQMVHIVPHVIELGKSATTGANVLASVGGASIIGRLAIGVISGRIGNRQTFITGFILTSFAFFWLAFTRETWGFYLHAIVLGFCMGSMTSLYAPMVAELFGLKWHGLIFGASGFLAMVGGTVGPIFTGYIFDLTGAYQIAFIILAVIGIAGLIFSALIRPIMIEKTG